jgi:hypothetical protein
MSARPESDRRKSKCDPPLVPKVGLCIAANDAQWLQASTKGAQLSAGTLARSVFGMTKKGRIADVVAAQLS